jgi:membrane-associated phospholipid phosphatase
VDAALFSLINGTHAPWLDPVMRVVSWLGYLPGIWFVSAVALLSVPRYRAAAWRMCLAVSLTYWITSGVIKPVVARERPYRSAMLAARLVESSPGTGYSFPSGHAATAAAGALAAARIFPGASTAVAVLAGVMAYSRIYVGVHYPSDVVAGAVLGALCALLVLGGSHASTWTCMSGDKRTPTCP